MRSRFLTAALAAVVLSLPGVAQATICGNAAFNHEINWPNTSDLYFNVTSSPANTCGDLWCWRNGSGFQLDAAGWICTNGSGAATKGPWSSSGHSSDETAYCYIDWSSCTSDVVGHIWDVTAPTPTISNGYPSSFSGTATDGSWGAGFSSSYGSYCETEFYDATPGVGKWWDFGAGTWTGTSPDYGPCFLSGMPSYSVSWSTSTLPSLTSSHHYYWKVLVWDAYGGNQGFTTVDFWY